METEIVIEKNHLSEEDDNDYLIILVVVFMGIGGIFREISKKTRIPYTPMLFVGGQIIGYFCKTNPEYDQFAQSIQQINPESILLCFLPVLIFDSAQNINFHQFKKQIVQISILAVPCVAISAFFIALSLKFILQYDDTYYTYTSAFLMGSILSCTDTAAVVALLKEVGAPQKFRSLIEGESLINDATCMILIIISMNIIKGNSNGIFEIIINFISLSGGGFIIGSIFGFIATQWIKKIYYDSVLIINITLTFSYLVYYCADHMTLGGYKCSGIISVLTFGLCMAIFGKNNLQTRDAVEALDQFWSYITYCAETVIFLIAGCIMGVKVLSQIQTYDDTFYKLFSLYLLMMMSRFLSIMVFYSVLKKHGYGFQFIDAIILTYGGIRGAIGISFALIVANDEYFDDKFKHILLLHISICAFLTLISKFYLELVNSTTAKFMIHLVGMVQFSAIRQNQNILITNKLIELIDEKIVDIQENEYLQEVDWNLVKEMNNINEYKDYIYALQMEIDNYQLKHQESIANKQKVSNDNSIIFEDLLENELVHEARFQFLQGLKNIYNDFIQQSIVTSDSFILLDGSVNMDLDETNERMHSWEYISIGLIQPFYINILFYLREYPLIKKKVQLLINNHIFQAFEVTYSFIKAHNQAECLFSNSQFDDEIINLILQESVDLRQAADQYLQKNLLIQYPEIISQVKLKLATLSLLEQQQSYLMGKMNVGQLDESEYMFFKNAITHQLKGVHNMEPDIETKVPKDMLKQIPLFKMLSEQDITDIISKSELMIFQEDQYIIKEHDLIKGIYVIFRGSGNESSSTQGINYKETKGQFDIIGLSCLCTQSFRYSTNFIANGILISLFIKKSTMKKFFRNDRFMEYLWKKSLYPLSRIYFKEFQQLTLLDNDSFHELLNYMSFVKHKKDSYVNLKNGGILLIGTCLHEGPNQVFQKQNQEVQQDNLSNNGNDSSSIESPYKRKSSQIEDNKDIKAYQMFVQPIELKCKTNCYFIHFASDIQQSFKDINQKVQSLSIYTNIKHSTKKRNTINV